MLFNSYLFILGFLPVALTIFFWLGGRGWLNAATCWLVLASLVFYGWWHPPYVVLVVGSTLFNFMAGRWIAAGQGRTRKGLLTVAVSANLLLLGYYKYAGFLVGVAGQVSGSSFEFDTILLPLAISFFTFQQIAYLVDVYRDETEEYSLLHYALFVTFFPQLVAGPIVHHKEMIGQFVQAAVYRLNPLYLAAGMTLFFIGLFKKVVIADSVEPFATRVFDLAQVGIPITLLDGWGGALAFTLQLYFDFSGYSDMALGLALMIGIRLPVNFLSPYQAVNIIDFWRRWHITLSRFLREYLYFPLGGNRKGTLRRYVNLLLTMLLGGLWHGAAWTFVVWGGVHGLMLVINHGWHALRRRLGHDLSRSTVWGRGLGRLLTLLAVTAAWVLFRADNFQVATTVLAGMAGQHGLGSMVGARTLIGPLAWAMLAGLLAMVLILPNSWQLMARLLAPDRGTATPSRWHWRPTLAYGAATAIMMVVALSRVYQTDEFIYFQF